MSSPLSGIRVLDLSRVLAAPMCSMALGDLGADVLKVEHPVRGDDTRGWGLKIGSTNSSYFNAANRNKECAAIDLKSPEGRELVLALVRQSDVLIQNFKTGDMDRLGLSYEALKALNPRLVYCSVTGYGSDGPEARRPGYDLVVQGETGLMALNGEEGQGPLKIGLAAVDMFTGQYAAQAVLAALFERERTGRGCHVEVALYDAGVSMVSYYGLQALAMGGDPLKYGNSHPAIVPYG
ncbi:MAG: CaiB/BaiF CoA transferase family protein, partial [Burkholderiaceae bacterium]